MRDLKGASDTPARVACRGYVHDNVRAIVATKLYINYGTTKSTNTGGFVLLTMFFALKSTKESSFVLLNWLPLRGRVSVSVRGDEAGALPLRGRVSVSVRGDEAGALPLRGRVSVSVQGG